MSAPAPPTRVGHVARDRGRWDVYIGRAMPRQRLSASPWSNPHRIGPTCTREEAIRNYVDHLMQREDLLALIPTLKGLTLGCWCHTVDQQHTTWSALDEVVCHGDLLARLADELPEGRDAINWARETLAYWFWQERRTNGASNTASVGYGPTSSEWKAQGHDAKASKGHLPRVAK